MSTNPRVTSARAPISYYPFDRAVAGSDLTEIGENIGVTEMIDIIKRDTYISYEFSGAISPGIGLSAPSAPGSTAYNGYYRAALFGPGSDPNFRWMSFITGKVGGLTLGAQPYSVMGDAHMATANIRDWYKWGMRKFWLHAPFGRVGVRGEFGFTGGHQEALQYQADAYYCAKHGCTCPIEGLLGNAPTPWITDDVINGVTEGFVPLFKALISGSSAGLSEDVWLRLTGTGADKWYDPNDPIEVTSYNGSINFETFRKWKRWFETDQVLTNPQWFGATGETEGMPAREYARYRLEKSFEPFKRAGMRIALDALVRAPGPINNLFGDPRIQDLTGRRYAAVGDPTNTILPAFYQPTGITMGAADRGWWNFFSEYVLSNWKPQDILMEAQPGSIPVYSGGWTGTFTGFTMNPYLGFGFGIAAGTEFLQAGFGSSPSSPPFNTTNSRTHYDVEYGDVEVINSFAWAPPPHIGMVLNGVTAYNGKYWYLRGVEQATDNFGSLVGIPSGATILRAPIALSNYPAESFYMQYSWAGELLRYTLQNDDPTTVESNKTKKRLLFQAGTIRAVDDFNMNVIRNQTGITTDFRRAFPTIKDFAKFVISIKNGKSSIEAINYTRNSSPTSNISDTIGDVTTVVKESVKDALTSSRIDGISEVMFLDPYEWDTFAGTNLRGISGGFYVPSSDVDIPQIKLNMWMDIKLKSWLEVFGKYPKYIAWKMTKNQGGPNSQLGQFQMERFLYETDSIPKTTGENSTAYDIKEEYFSFPPIWNSAQGEGIRNQGYAAPSLSNQNGNFYWDAATTIVQEMLLKTQQWRDLRKLTGIKIGLDNFPYLPETPYSVYRWTGGSSETSFELVASANWNDTVFPKPNPRPTNGQAYQGGLAGWYTAEETADIKKRISIEYRKRLEPVAEFCEFVLPEVLCKSASDILSDSRFPGRQQYHRELVNLCYDMKTIRQWIPTILNVSNPPVLRNDKIFAVTSLSYEGVTFNDYGFPINPGDPLTRNLGSLFDREKFNYAVVDFLRDEFFRPVRGIPRKIDGLFFNNKWDDRAFRAMNTTAYSGREADRDWVYKWLVADGGVGATIDWNNSTDVTNKVKEFFRVKKNLTAYYKNRFDRGQPRIDRVADPYRYTPFAITWHPGYENGLHPPVLGGITISDVLPSIFAGWTFIGSGILRPGGDTGNIPTDHFNDIVRRIRNVPEGRRVLIPYYWHEDPIADQTQQIDYYKATSDGATYNGTVPYRTHETPGRLKFTTPWAYKQTADAALSIGTFFRELAATGAYIDYVACDAEAWRQQFLSSNVNAFAGPWGPTGMPAEYLNSNSPVVVPLQSWKQVPDPRQTPAVFSDPRFGTLVNSFNGKTMGQNVLDAYKIIFSNRINAFTPTRDSYADPNTDAGITATQLMHYYIHEGVTGISASTGSAWVNSYGQPRFDPVPSFLLNPWREPWFPSYTVNAFGRTINKYLTWHAYEKALGDIVMGDLIKKCWFDVIAGSTNERTRRVPYSHYEIMPTGITEGVFAADTNGHLSRMHGHYPHIEPSSESYGELNFDLRRARYYISPQTDFERHQFAYHSPLRGTDGVDYVTFYSNSGGKTVPARSYIAFLKEMTPIRAMLRNRPDSWKRFNPWVTSQYESFFNTGWREDQQNATDIEDRTTPAYGNELTYHFLVSGAKHINYFHTGARESGKLVGPGYTAGIIEMQLVLDSWKTQSEGYRVQPVSTADGSADTLQERILMSDVGGNHPGATGVFMSGCKLLNYNNGRTGSNGDTVEKFLWRITAAPQATQLYRVNTPDSSDLPPAIDLVRGYSDFVRAETTATGEGTFTARILGNGVIQRDVSIGGTSGFLISTATNQSVRANSGVELHHSNATNPNETPAVPYLVGSGRPIEFEMNASQVDGSGYDPDWYSGISGSCASQIGIGLYNKVIAFGNHNGGWRVDGVVSSHPTPPMGLKSGLIFQTIGGSWIRTTVAWFDPIDNTYKQSSVEHTSKSLYSNNKFRINIEPDGSAVNFVLNGEIIRSITSGSVDSTGNVIRIPNQTYAPWGLWGGAFVTDMTMVANTGVSGVVGSPDTLFVKSGGSPSKVIVSKNNTDASVTVSPNSRGVWIKRNKKNPPRYKMTEDLQTQLTITPAFTGINATNLTTTATLSPNYTISGINTPVNLSFAFSSGTYATSGSSQFIIQKNGSTVQTVDTVRTPQGTVSVTVNGGDVLRFGFHTTRSATDFLVSVTNSTAVPVQSVGSIRCRYTGTIPDTEDASDYEVWASSSLGDVMTTSPDVDTYYSVSFPYTQYTSSNSNIGSLVPVDIKGIVPAISSNSNYDAAPPWTYARNTVAYTNFNGYRRPDDRNIPSFGQTDSYYNLLKRRLDLSPDGRRVFTNRFLSKELSYESRNHLTTIADFSPFEIFAGVTIPNGAGYTYEYNIAGVTFRSRMIDLYPGSSETPVLSTVVQAEATRLRTTGITIDWYRDDRQSEQYWHMFGVNSYNYWSGNCYNVDGLPIDPYPVIQQGFSPIMPDARVVSAVAQNPIRGYTGQILHSRTGLSFGAHFVQNYRDISGDLSMTQSNWRTFIAPLTSCTGATAWLGEDNVWTEYPDLGGSTGFDRIPLGYTFSRFVAPAWNATVDLFHHGAYLYDPFKNVYGNSAGSLPNQRWFRDTKFSQHGLHPIEPSEVQYTSYNNQEVRMQRIMPSPLGKVFCSMYDDSYGIVGKNKMLKDSLLPSGITSMLQFNFGTLSIPTEVLRDGISASNLAQENASLGTGNNLPNRTTYLTDWGQRSGYIRNPVTDSERFSWKGHLISGYNGPAGSANLVRYPITIPYDTTSGITLQAPAVIDEFWNELCYKYVVNYTKQLRLTHRSDSTLWERWCPWISDPGYENSVFSRGVTGFMDSGKRYAPFAVGYTSGSLPMAGLAYWYEQTFHDILHGAQHLHHWRDRLRVDRGGIGNLQSALDEWRRISNNSRAVPIVRTTDTPENGQGATLDRILLEEAFDKALVSGARLISGPSAGWNIWRITVAPHHFVGLYGQNQEVTLTRVGSDTEFPGSVTLTRNGGNNPINSRGAWITTTSSNPLPQYTVDTDGVPDALNWTDMSAVQTLSSTQELTVDGMNIPITLGLSFSGTFGDSTGSLKILNRGAEVGSVALTSSPASVVDINLVRPGNDVGFIYSPGTGGMTDFNVRVLNRSRWDTPLDTFRCSSIAADFSANAVDWSNITVVQNLTGVSTQQTISGINAPVLIGVTFEQIGAAAPSDPSGLLTISKNGVVQHSIFLTGPVPTEKTFMASSGDVIEFGVTAGINLSAFSPNGYTLGVSVINKYDTGGKVLDSFTIRAEVTDITPVNVTPDNLVNSSAVGEVVGTPVTLTGFNTPVTLRFDIIPPYRFGTAAFVRVLRGPTNTEVTRVTNLNNTTTTPVSSGTWSMSPGQTMAFGFDNRVATGSAAGTINIINTTDGNKVIGSFTIAQSGT